jgi:hypothetical protein
MSFCLAPHDTLSLKHIKALAEKESAQIYRYP